MVSLAGYVLYEGSKLENSCFLLLLLHGEKCKYCPARGFHFLVLWILWFICWLHHVDAIPAQGGPELKATQSAHSARGKGRLHGHRERGDRAQVSLAVQEGCHAEAVRRFWQEFRYVLAFKSISYLLIIQYPSLSIGLKPGVCYPTNEELEYLQQYESKFEQSVQKMRDDLKRRQKEAIETREARVKEVEKGLAKLPTLKKDFWSNYHSLYEDIEREKEKKEKVIQEVREFLGYDIQPNDPRFEEALLKKDEDEKAAMRAARKLEKQRQGMEMLQEMVAAALEKEKKKGGDATKKPEEESPAAAQLQTEQKKNSSD